MSSSNVLELVGLLAIALPFTLVVVTLGVMWRAWWLFPAWAWFLVPLGVPQVAFWHFAGLLLLVDTLKRVDVKKDDRKYEWASIVVVFCWPIVAWALMRWMR